MSTAPFTVADIRAILIDRIGLLDADIPDDRETAFTDLDLDSLAIVEVQLAVQQQYGFAISDADAGSLQTFAGLIDFVNERLAAPEVA
jgi:acyl carrier protein